MEERLIIFDLDFTLWDAGGTWCDHTTPPYKKVNAHIVDRDQREILLYPDVPGILQALQKKRIPMGLASRTHSPETASRFLSMFGIAHHFSYRQIYPGSKVRHFQYLQQDSGISYQNMYFFDDEPRNISEVGALGVHAFLVSEGLRWEDIRRLQWEEFS
jgi:magnesium-dependent phosphatase 1